MTDITTLPISDLDQLGNVPFTSLVDQNLQYQQAGFALHTWFSDPVNGLGASVEMSSDGNANAGLGDFILTSLNIVNDIESSLHSWAVYNIGGTRFLVNFNAPAGPNPQGADIYRTEAVPYNNDGTTSTRPTPSAVDRESTVLNWNLIGWAVPVGGTISYQWSNSQQIGWFWTKSSAANGTSSFLIIERAAVSDDFYDGIRSWFILGGSNVLDIFALSSSGRISGYDGTAGSDIQAFSPFYAKGISLPNGLCSDGKPRLLPVKYLSNATSSVEDRRVGGYSQLLMKAPANTLFNQTDPLDPVLDPWAWRVMGSVGFLWKKTDGDIP